MKYIEKTLNDTITVTGLVNLHFFEFSKDFYTEDEQHPFYELVYVATGKINIRSARYSRKKRVDYPLSQRIALSFLR